MNGGVHKTPDNVADAVNMLNREGTKYLKLPLPVRQQKRKGVSSVLLSDVGLPFPGDKQHCRR